MDRESHPQLSVTDLPLTVFAPLGDKLRVGAMAEVGGYDLSIPEDRIAKIVTAVDALFPGAAASRACSIVKESRAAQTY